MEDPLPAPGLVPVTRYGYVMEVVLACGHRTIVEMPTSRYLAACGWCQDNCMILYPTGSARELHT